MVKLSFLGKEVLMKTDWGLFLLLLLLESDLLSGQRKQNQVPKTSKYEKEREKKGKAGKQLLELSHAEASVLERGSTLPYQCQD